MTICACVRKYLFRWIYYFCNKTMIYNLCRHLKLDLSSSAFECLNFMKRYEVCLKSIGTVCFAQTTLATVIKALFFKMAQCLVVVKM